MRIKGLQEPDNDRRDKNYAEGTLQKVLGLIPHQQQDTLPGRESIIRQLHDKRHRIAPEPRRF